MIYYRARKFDDRFTYLKLIGQYLCTKIIQNNSLVAETPSLAELFFYIFTTIVNLLNNIPYNIMCCSNISRCNNFNLIKVNNYRICLSCNSVFKKNKKVLIKCCKNRIINRINSNKNRIINHRTNMPHCINCLRFVYS